MFEREYARRKAVRRVIREHRDRPCGERRPLVVVFGYKVHRDSRFAQTSAQNGLVYAVSIHPGAAKPRQWSGMNIHDPAAILRDDGCGHQSQVSCQRDDVNVVRVKNALQVAVAASIERHCLDLSASRPIQRAGILPVGSGENDLAPRCVAKREEMIENSLKI